MKQASKSVLETERQVSDQAGLSARKSIMTVVRAVRRKETLNEFQSIYRWRKQIPKLT